MQQENATAAERVMSARGRRLIGLLMLVGAVICYRHREWIQAQIGPFFESVEALGAWAYVVGTLAYIAACVCLIPTTFLAPGLGFALGFVGGTIVSLLGATFGAGANYFIARFLGRHWFDHHVAKNHRFRAVEIACRTRGFQVVLLTRLTPVFPSNIMSYFYGITNVPLDRFLLATSLGMLPRILVYTTLGAAAKSFTAVSEEALHEQPLWNYMLYGSVVVTAIVFVLITRIANRCLKQALDEVEAMMPPSPPAPSDPAQQTAATVPLTEAETS